MGGRSGKLRGEGRKHPRPIARAALRPVCRERLVVIRQMCRELPGTTEVEAWGRPTFRTPQRMFAMFMCDHHGDGRVALWCRAAAGAQAGLVAAEPERFFVPPYVGPSGWVGLDLTRTRDAEVHYMLREAWRLSATPALRRRLDAES
jgi:hypothetical protein